MCFSESRGRSSLLLLFAVVLTASPASAQASTSIHDFAAALRQVRPGQVVVVNAATGGSLTGKVVVPVGPDLTLLKDGQSRSFTSGDVHTLAIVEHRITAMGVAAGAGAGIVAAAFFVNATRDCGGCGYNGEALVYVLFAGIGAGGGTAIQYAIPHRRLIYSAPNSSGSLSVAPVLVPGTRGIAGAWRF
jgi:hypothetical protein